MMSGKMDKYIVIEQPTYTVSTKTNQKEVASWSTYVSVSAKRVIKQSAEVFEEGQLVLKDVIEWSFRYYDAESIASDMRVSFDSEYYYIIGLRELGRKDGWLLMTIKRDN